MMPYDEQAILADYASPMRVNDLLRKHHISRDTLARIRKRHGVPVRAPLGRMDNPGHKKRPGRERCAVCSILLAEYQNGDGRDHEWPVWRRGSKLCGLCAREVNSR